ncbi:MAG: rhomboid family intramembrane serine protease [Blastocatellia bacterium]|nr:rhomboid family intramembrane serine protease [Blastocatellia bacterium]
MSLQYQSEPDETVEGVLAVEPPPPVEVIGPPVYTSALIACFAAVSIAQFAVGLDPSVLIAGFDKPAFLGGGEYWRILTGAVLHGGLAHIALNSFAFYSFGRLSEYLSDRAHTAIVFLIAAIAGGAVSAFFVPEGRSVGASGGILGVVGYLAAYTIQRRKFVTPEFRRSLLMNIGFILIFGLVLYQVIDNYAHIGGLAAGAVYGFLQVPSDPHKDPRESGSSAEIMGLAALATTIAVSIFSIYLLLS